MDLFVDTQLVMGLHVDVLSPLSWVCPEGRLGEPADKLGVRTRMGPCLPLRMDVFWRQGQCEINGHQIVIKESPKLCQDPKLRNEDSVGLLPTIQPTHPRQE